MGGVAWISGRRSGSRCRWRMSARSTATSRRVWRRPAAPCTGPRSLWGASSPTGASARTATGPPCHGERVPCRITRPPGRCRHSGDVQPALAYVETATDSIAVAARLAHLEPLAEATEGPGRLAVDQNTCPDGVDGTHRIDLQAQIGRELNRVVSHGIFEAILAINGALQYVCDPVAELRIEGAVEGLDETIGRFRTIVSMLENPDA